MKFIVETSKMWRKVKNFHEKFIEYRIYFDNKEGIFKYFDEDQYLKLKDYLMNWKKF